jgi:hypothetical protein
MSTYSEKQQKTTRELGYIPAKTKTPQPQKSDTPQGRDLFQTPNYAVDLLVPFIPKNITWIWEPACGDGKIVQRLTENSYSVYPSDIRKSSGWIDNWIIDFLDDEKPTVYSNNFAIITNPPFSIKQKFYYRCMAYRVPFALLIPADYSGWIIDACRLEGAEKIIPNRRIDYITPNTITRVNEGEGTNYRTIDEIPQRLLHKYSSSDFHSMWLTWGFNLGKSETYVELSLKEKKNNI